MFRPRRSPLLGYGLAVLASALALLLTLLLRSVVEPTVFLVFFGAVAVSAAYGGLGPGLLATGLGVLAVAYLFYAPTYSFAVANSYDALRIGGFALIGWLMSWLGHARKQAEETATGERSRLEVTLSSIGDAVIATDASGRISFINPVAQALTGWEGADAIAKPLDEVFRIVAEASREAVENPVSRVLREGTVVGLANHTLLIARDGSEIPIDDSAAPIRGSGGELAGVVLVFRDVAERRQAELDREQDRRQLEIILGGVADGIIAQDPTGRIIYVNDAAARLAGFPTAQALVSAPAEQIYRRLEILDERGQPFPLDQLPGRRALHGEARPEATVRLRLPATGEEHWLVVRSTPVHDDGDDPLFVISILHDVTDRRRAEEELRQAKEQLEVILGGVADGITVQEPSGRLIYANDAAARVTGYPNAEALVAAPVAEVVQKFEIMNERGEPLPLSALPGRLALQGKPSPEVTVCFRIRATGEERWSVVRATPVFGANGRVLFAINIFHDITERKRAEEALAARERQQAAVAELGLRALSEVEIPALSDEACALVARTLGVAQAAILELMPEDGNLLVRAGTGWQVGIVGEFRVGTETSSLAGYTLHSGEAVVVEDWAAERRFNKPAGLRSHGVESSISVIIHTPGSEDGRPYGVLGAYASEPRAFTNDDVYFLQAIANVLAVAIERARREAERARLLASEQAARTAAEAAQSRVAFLAEASEVLASSLEYETTLASVARLAVPRLADWCAVDVVGEEGTLQRLAVMHTDPARVELAHELQQRYPADPDAPGTTRWVLRSGEPLLVREVPDALLSASARDPEHLRLMRELGLFSYMIVPLISRGEVLGTIIFASAESRRRYGEEELALAQELARRAAQAIDNARLYRDAQEAVRIRDAFFSIASHELKTPLTVLQGYAEILQRRAEREGTTNERDMRALRTIHDQTVQLHRLIELLLDLSRIQTGRLEIDRAPLDLVALTRRVVEAVQPTLDRHTVQLVVGKEPLTVAADELRLEQVVQNLLQNAIKYSPHGGPVEVRLERQGEDACLSVTDRGIGIPEEALPDLFTRFYRARNVAARQISGMGLGLYVVREIVTLHEGRVEVESREGEGSTFRVCFAALDAE